MIASCACPLNAPALRAAVSAQSVTTCSTTSYPTPPRRGNVESCSHCDSAEGMTLATAAAANRAATSIPGISLSGRKKRGHFTWIRVPEPVPVHMSGCLSLYSPTIFGLVPVTSTNVETSVVKCRTVQSSNLTLWKWPKEKLGRHNCDWSRRERAGGTGRDLPTHIGWDRALGANPCRRSLIT